MRVTREAEHVVIKKLLVQILLIKMSSYIDLMEINFFLADLFSLVPEIISVNYCLIDRETIVQSINKKSQLCTLKSHSLSRWTNNKMPLSRAKKHNDGKRNKRHARFINFRSFNPPVSPPMNVIKVRETTRHDTLQTNAVAKREVNNKNCDAN